MKRTSTINQEPIETCIYPNAVKFFLAKINDSYVLYKCDGDIFLEIDKEEIKQYYAGINLNNVDGIYKIGNYVLPAQKIPTEIGNSIVAKHNQLKSAKLAAQKFATEEDNGYFIEITQEQPGVSNMQYRFIIRKNGKTTMNESISESELDNKMIIQNKFKQEKVSKYKGESYTKITLTKAYGERLEQFIIEKKNAEAIEKARTWKQDYVESVLEFRALPIGLENSGYYLQIMHGTGQIWFIYKKTQTDKIIFNIGNINRNQISEDGEIQGGIIKIGRYSIDLNPKHGQVYYSHYFSDQKTDKGRILIPAHTKVRINDNFGQSGPENLGEKIYQYLEDIQKKKESTANIAKTNEKTKPATNTKPVTNITTKPATNIKSINSVIKSISSDYNKVYQEFIKNYSQSGKILAKDESKIQYLKSLFEAIISYSKGVAGMEYFLINPYLYNSEIYLLYTSNQIAEILISLYKAEIPKFREIPKNSDLGTIINSNLLDHGKKLLTSFHMTPIPAANFRKYEDIYNQRKNK